MDWRRLESGGRCRSGAARAVQAASLAAFCVAGTGVAGAQTVLYVDATAPASGNGLSWTTAFNDLRRAIESTTQPVEIRVAVGTYRADMVNPGDRLATFLVRNGVVIRGGYEGLGGGGGLLRDPVQFPTVLSGDFGVIDDNSDNAYHVVTVDPGQGGLGTLDGVIIRGGNASLPSATDSGGGVLVKSGSVVINASRLESNSASSGGALANLGLNTLTLADCVLSLNQAVGSGGAIQAVLATVILDRCTIEDGFAGTGAGMYSLSSTVTIRDSVFQRNWSQTQGGALHVQQGSAQVLRTLMDSNLVLSGANSGTIGGGAVMVDNATVRIGRCVLKGNSSYRTGGAVFQSAGWLTIHSSELIANTASGDGGGVALTGGSATIASTVFNANRTLGRGGALYAGTPSPTLSHCTIYGNISQSTNAGGVQMNGGTLNANGCLFWANRNLSGVTELAQMIDAVQTRPRFARTCFQSWTGRYIGTDMTTANPLLANPLGADAVAGTADDDLRPVVSSPLVDAGSTVFLPADVMDLNLDANVTQVLPLDARGELRQLDCPTVADTGAGPLPIPDIGALERRCPADLTLDGEVDFADFLAFFNWYDAGDLGADVESNGLVDFGDFLAFFGSYDVGC